MHSNGDSHIRNDSTDAVVYLDEHKGKKDFSLQGGANESDTESRIDQAELDAMILIQHSIAALPDTCNTSSSASEKQTEDAISSHKWRSAPHQPGRVKNTLDCG